MTLRAVIAVAGLLLLMPASHLEVSAAFASKGPGRGEVAVFLGTSPTALSVLSLTPAYQLLPIYQR